MRADEPRRSLAAMRWLHVTGHAAAVAASVGLCLAWGLGDAGTHSRSFAGLPETAAAGSGLMALGLAASLMAFAPISIWLRYKLAALATAIAALIGPGLLIGVIQTDIFSEIMDHDSWRQGFEGAASSIAVDGYLFIVLHLRHMMPAALIGLVPAALWLGWRLGLPVERRGRD